ncbi:MAG TPA: TlpA disulfide reductase family protein [Thermoanaerobaculia bacterium]|nr:TlpA disulfide reductase family protein [Thermoanaerobaculia bacterium]
MPWKYVAVLFALCLSPGSLHAAEPQRSADPSPRAREILAAAARAYRTVPALRDTMTYVVQAPGSEKEPKKLEYGFGAGTDAFVKDPLLQAVAVGDRMFLTRSDAPRTYVAVPYHGDFGAALNGIVGDQGSLFEPPPVAMRTGKGIDAWIDALRCKLLAPPLRITGVQRIAGPGGELMDEIRFAADNGEVALRLDPATHFFAALAVEMRPPGAPRDLAIHVDATFAPQVLPSAAGVVHFEPGDRTAVSDLAGLGSSRLTPGAPAPDFALETLDGRKVALRDLRGSVVVLDFWATWCVPCWKTLRETQALFDWAAKERLPVAVFGVDALEQLPSREEKKQRAAAFWQSQKFTLPTLLDPDGVAFRAFGAPGLPSMVLVAPDGTILAFHESLFPDMLETLKKEVREGVRAPAKPVSR